MQFQPDALTLMLSAALISPLIAAAVFFLWRQTRERALGWWAGGSFAMAAGTLSALGSAVEPALGGLGMPFVLLGHWLFLMGIHVFRGAVNAPRQSLHRVVMLTIIGLAFATLVLQSPLIPPAGASLATGLVALLCAYWLIFDHPEARASACFTGSIFAIDAIVQFLTGSLPFTRFDSAELHTLLSAGAFILLVGWNFGFLMLIGERNQERVTALANRDDLTGASTRRALFETGRPLFAIAGRQRRALVVMMMDIDHFKRINDTHGHAIGDAVLRRFAEIAAGCLRDADLFGRVGGEEFCVVLPDTGLDGALNVAERIRAGFASHPVELRSKRVAATVSIGIAQNDAAARDLEALIARADDALYQAKRNGRNRIVVAAPEDNAPPQIRMVWDGRYRSGNAAIDEEHEQLFTRANALINQLRHHAADATLVEELRQLLFWLGEHFRNEERVLAEAGWGDLERHTEQHRALEQRGAMLLQEVESGRRNCAELLDFVVMEVIARHLALCDVEFFSRLQAAAKSP